MMRRSNLLTAGFFCLIFLPTCVAAQDFLRAPGGDWAKAHADSILNYVTWDGTKWSAKIQGGGFLHAPNGDWGRAHADTIINYVTWDGTKWSAKIQGGARSRLRLILISGVDGI